MELVVRPKTHTKEGLSERQVVDIILSAIDSIQKHNNVSFKLILYVSTNVDDPIDFRRTAEIVHEYRNKGVVGFGIFGDEDISPNAFSYFHSTFSFLKQSRIKIVIFAGRNDANTMVHAIKNGASRISGGFECHGKNE